MLEGGTLSHNSFKVHLATNVMFQIQFLLCHLVFQFGDLAVGFFQSRSVAYDLLESALIRVLITEPELFIRSDISSHKGPPVAESLRSDGRFHCKYVFSDKTDPLPSSLARAPYLPVRARLEANRPTHRPVVRRARDRVRMHDL